MAGAGQKGNTSEIGGGSEYVAATVDQCSPESGIEKILLPQFPTNQFVSGRPRRTRSGFSHFVLHLQLRIRRDRIFRRRTQQGWGEYFPYCVAILDRGQ